MVSFQEWVMMPRVRYYTYKTSQPWAKYHTPNAKGSSCCICRRTISIIEYKILHQPKICTVTHCHTLEKKNLGFHDKNYFLLYLRRRRFLHCLLSDKERLIRTFKRKKVCDKSHIVTYLSKFTQVFVQKTVWNIDFGSH